MRGVPPRIQRESARALGKLSIRVPSLSTRKNVICLPRTPMELRNRKTFAANCGEGSGSKPCREPAVMEWTWDRTQPVGRIAWHLA
jgi:hypothetical protein